MMTQGLPTATLNILFEQSPFAIIIYSGNEFLPAQSNASARRLHGDLLGLDQIIHADDRFPAQRQISRIVSQNTSSISFESRVLHSNGDFQLSLFNVWCQEHATGAPIDFICTITPLCLIAPDAVHDYSPSLIKIDRLLNTPTQQSVSHIESSSDIKNKARPVVMKRSEWLRMALNAAHLNVFELYLPTWQLSIYNTNTTDFENEFTEMSFDFWAAAIHEDDRKKVFNEFNAFLEDKSEMYTTEIRTYMEDKNTTWSVSAWKVVEPDSVSEPKRVFGTFVDISKIKISEEALIKSEQLLKHSERLTKVGSWIINSKTKEIQWSEETYSIFSESRKNISARLDFLSYVHPEDLAHIQEAWIRMIQQHDVFNEEHRIVTAQGIKWIHNVARHIKDEGGFEAIIGSIQDVTTVREMSDALTTSEQKLNAIVRSAPLVLFSADLTGIVTFSAGLGLAKLGRRPDENVGLSIYEIYKHVPEIAASFPRALAGETISFKSQVSSVVFDNLIAPLVNSSGQMVGVLGMSVDVTEKEMHEQLTRKKNSELQSIMDALNESSLVSITDLNGKILKVNQRFCDIARYTQEELIGKDHSITQSGHHDHAFWKELWKTINAGVVWRGEIKNKTSQGEHYWVDTVVNPIRDETGKITHFLSIRQDITDRKKYEQLLLERNERLSQIEQYINITSEAIHVLDGNGNLIYTNKVAAEWLEIDQENCHHSNAIETVPAFNDPGWRRQLNTLKLKGSISTDILNINRKTGVCFPVEVTTRLVTIQGKEYIISVSRDITERKKNEEALQAMQDRLAHVQQVAKLGYWESDFISKTVWFSDQMYELMGVRKLESNPIIGCSFFYNLVHPEDQRAVFEDKGIFFIDDHLSLRPNGIYRFRIIRPDGEIRYLQCYTNGTQSKEGILEKLSGIAQDVTESLYVEKALRESEQTLKNAQTVAKIGSWKKSPDSPDMIWSEEGHCIFGIKYSEGSKLDEFISRIHPEDSLRITTIWKSALQLSPYDQLYRIVVNNSVKWVRSRSKLIHDESGKVMYALGTVQDITDQKNLQDVNHIFNYSQLHTGIGSWKYTIRSNEMFWSENIYNLLDLNKQLVEASFKNFLKAIHPEDLQQFISKLKASLLHKHQLQCEYRVKMSDNIVRWMSTSANLVTNHMDKVIELYGITRDITVEKGYMEELEKARKQAEEAGIIKDEFLSVMSHEIRTPLNSVIGLSVLLLRRDPREDQLDILKTLKGSADNLLHLVNDILDFSKIRAGKLELEILKFSITDFLKQLHSSFNLSAIDKGLELNIQIDPSIPEILQGDITRLNQIFNNLLSNAIKFTQKGYVHFEVNLVSRIENECLLEFKLEDTGVGIASDKLDSVFDPFNQSESDIARKFGGTGLGLTIVKALVEILKGQLTVSSTKGKGSSFVVTILLRTPDFEDVQSQQQLTSLSKATSQRKRKISILYVEDVESNRFLIENLLSDNYTECCSASSGPEALLLAKNRKFDLILMDIQMPGMDGYQTTKKLRTQVKGKNKTTPILAFTAEPYSERLRLKVNEYGIQDVITKPFETDLLLTKIETYSHWQKNKEAIFDFLFYESTFSNDPVKLNKIRLTVISDLKQFEKVFASHHEKNNSEKLKRAIHAVKPILKNLNATTLLLLLEEYSIQSNNSRLTKTLLNRIMRLLKYTIAQLQKTF